MCLGLLYFSAFSVSQVPDSLFSESCKNENLLILNEEVDVHITGLKVKLMIATVTKHQSIVIQNQQGLLELQAIKIPQKLDELYIFHAPSVRNIDWAYDDVTIRHFEARKAPDNEPLQTIQKVVPKQIINLEGYFGELDEFIYTIENIEIGDTIELSYSYEIPFNTNWIYLLSNRVFFNGKYPKKNYSLNWCYNKYLVVDSLFINSDIPETSIVMDEICYHWNLKNLPGCLDEPGSRPYKDLAHLVFVPRSYDFEYTHYNSYKQEFVPTYFFEANDVQSKLYTERWDNIIGNKNKNNNAYGNVADRYNRWAPDDSTGLNRMRYFQRFMVDSVTYDPAINYYSYNENHIKQRAGVDLKARIVKDNNIERVYGNIIPRFGLDFFTAYPIDSRMGEISPQYNPTVKDNDLILGVAMNDKTLCFVIPKSDKNNYYFEELPYYYEDIPVLLLHFLDFPNGLEKRNFNTEFRTLKTPASGWKDNYRKVQGKVVIDLDNDLVNFQTRVMLSGQYSTLTRNVYNKLPLDSTINLKYFEPVWNISDNVKVKSYKLKEPHIYYPFKTSVTAMYSCDNQIINDNDQIKIKIGNWFTPVYYEGIVNEIRFLDYYPDFVGYDNYSYMLEFNKDIDLVNKDCDISIKNDYANLGFNVKQTSDKTILVTCNYSILTRKVEKDNIEQVKAINRAIEELLNKEIIVRLK